MSALLRLLLRLCPRDFRDTWGLELSHVYAQAWCERRRHSRPRASRLAVSLLLDLVLMVPAAWRQTLRPGGGGSPDPHRPNGSGGRRLLVDGVSGDVQHALRQWRSAPGFASLTIGTLALGMGAAIAIFSVVNGVLLRPMPYRDPGEVALLTRAYPADLLEVERHALITDVVPWSGWRAGFQDADGSMTIRHSASVGAGYFETLGINAALGRTFARRDSLGDARTVVLAWHAWRADFGGRPDVVGSSVLLDGQAYTIIGVLPERFADPLGFPVNDIETSIYRLRPPLPPQAYTQRQFPSARAVVRLRAGVTPDAAQAAIEQDLADEYSTAGVTSNLRVESAYEARVGSVRTTLLVLSGAVTLLVLIGCVNASNLLLARGSLRQREMAVRTAVGAGRWRLTRQLLTESLLLGVVAGALGIWVGHVGAKGILLIARESVPRAEQVLLDGRVLLFTGAATLLTTLLFGLMPALRISRAAPAATLYASARTATDTKSGRRLRKLLVGAEIALAVVLTFTAGLIMVSLQRLQTLDPGYDDDEVLTIRVTMSHRDFAPPVRYEVRHQIAQAVAALPDVEAAAFVDYHPLSGGGGSAFVSSEPLAAPTDGASAPAGSLPALGRAISAEYFRAMGMRLVAGRAFGEHDREGSEAVAIVSESLARKLFPDASVLDAVFYVNGQALRIVGIARDAKEFSLSEGETPVLYVPMAQIPGTQLIPTSTFLVRARQGSSASLAPSVRSAMRTLDPRLQVAFLRTMREMMDIDLLAPRLRSTLFGTFGALAGLLALVGIAGVVGYTVAQRIPEIGVRLALGATRTRIALAVLQEIAIVAVLGLAAGAAGAIAAGRVVASMLFQVPPSSAPVLAAVSALLFLLALCACVLPLRRATRVQPASVLRTS